MTATGGWLFFHGPDLNRRGVGSQDDIVRYVKGVLHVSGRVILGDVQGLEIVPVAFDLGPFHDVESQPHKNIADFLGDPADRVKTAQGNRPAGKGDIDVCLQTRLGGFELMNGVFESLVDRIFDVIGALAHCCPFFRRHLADAL